MDAQIRSNEKEVGTEEGGGEGEMKGREESGAGRGQNGRLGSDQRGYWCEVATHWGRSDLSACHCKKCPQFKQR